MAAKKTSKKTPLKRKKKAAKKPPTKAVSKKAPKAASTATTEAAPAAVKKQSKTSFVLSLPSEMPAKDVVAKAKEAGISLTEKAVYKTRYLARNKAPRAAKKAPVKAAVKAPSKPAEAPKKAGKRGPGDGSGSAFIRQQALSLKAGEVVAAAAKKGITITAGLVYSVRASMKKSGAKATKAPSTTPSGKRRGRPPAAAKAASQVVAVGGGDKEKQLISLALDLGLGRSVELIEGIRAKIGSLI